MTDQTHREKTLTRRGFLRGSSLLAAAVVGVGLAGSRSLFAQDGASGENSPKPTAPAGDPPAGDAPPETKHDSRGIPYRDCPECGGKMYKDDGKTWVCESCGYSYAE